MEPSCTEIRSTEVKKENSGKGSKDLEQKKVRYVTKELLPKDLYMVAQKTKTTLAISDLIHRKRVGLS